MDSLLSSYDYQLESDLIAQYPLEPRHSARLMIVGKSLQSKDICEQLTVWDLQYQLRAGDLLVLNDTRVLKARLRVRLSGGAKAELLILEPRGDGLWLCLGRPAKKMFPGEILWLEALEQDQIGVKVVNRDMATGGVVVQLPSKYNDRENIENLLECYGEVPLPPYIENHDPNAEKRYQTMYANRPGAVAAPTAGLHLSDDLLRRIEKIGVRKAMVTLHVGLGTFRPLVKEDLTDLQLHSEWVEVGDEVVKEIHSCHANGGRVFAVGTTSVRALEAAFILGDGVLKPFAGSVDLVIKPGFQFGVVDGLLTNFHLPKSSLLLLVSALIGRERLLKQYEKAIKENYRFFSYGDAMLIPPEAVVSTACRRGSKDSQ